MTEITINTKSKVSMEDITSKVREVIKNHNIKDGICVLFVPHTTAAVTINENADPDVVRDILYALDKTFPKSSSYKHIEGNSHAHLKASSLGSSQTIIVCDGRLLLGTWQGIYFCEFDGPRRRQVCVQII